MSKIQLNEEPPVYNLPESDQYPNIQFRQLSKQPFVAAQFRRYLDLQESNISKKQITEQYFLPQ